MTFLNLSNKSFLTAGVVFLSVSIAPHHGFKCLLGSMISTDKSMCSEVPIRLCECFAFQFPSTIITHGADVIHPSITDSLDYEAELAVIIGQPGSRISESEALNHVFGYTVANDITARDWQKEKNGRQWLLGKSMNTFCPLG